jgi:hypothetical protein
LVRPYFKDITTIFKHLEDEQFTGVSRNAAQGVRKPGQIHKVGPCRLTLSNPR